MQTRIDAAKWHDQHWIRLSGPATFTAAPTLLDFVDRVLDNGAVEINLDLAACCWMDSTFAGTLVSLSKRGNRDRPVQLRLHNPSIGEDPEILVIEPSKDPDSAPAANVVPTDANTPEVAEEVDELVAPSSSTPGTGTRM